MSPEEKRAYQNEYRKKNADKINKQIRESRSRRYKEDPEFREKVLARNRKNYWSDKGHEEAKARSRRNYKARMERMTPEELAAYRAKKCELQKQCTARKKKPVTDEEVDRFIDKLILT